MANKTKLILTAIGLAAIIVPALLLLFFTSQKPQETNSSVPAGGRIIDKSNIEKEVKSTQNAPRSPVPTPVVFSPVPTASPSPLTTLESTPSSQ